MQFLNSSALKLSIIGAVLLLMLCADEVDSLGWFRGGRFGRRGGSWFRRGGGSRFRIGGGSRFRRNGGNRFGRNGGQRIWSRIFRFTNQSPQFATSNPNVQPIFQPRITDFTTARPFFVAEPKINFNPPQTVVHPAVIPIPTVAQVHTIRTQLFQMLTDDLLGPWVELGFHQCVGGCDGCVNLQHKGNKALTNIVTDLFDTHKQFSQLITFADYVMLSAVVAADKGLANTGSSIRIGARYGRKTCADPLNSDKIQNLPDGGDPHALEVCQQELNLSQQEVVALLGAHSLGKCHRDNQGYEGAWDFTPTKLDSGYYQSLIHTTWIPVVSPGSKIQWLAEDEKSTNLLMSSPSRMMLHSDIGMKVIFDVAGAANIPTCPVVGGGTASVGCPFSAFKPTVEMYSNNNAMFQRDFAAVFQKMLEHTSDPLQGPR